MRYLLVTFFRKANGQIDEQVVVSKRVKPADLQSCNLIMDFQERKLTKAVVEGRQIQKDWNKMYEYYNRIYPTLINQLDKANQDATKTQP